MQSPAAANTPKVTFMERGSTGGGRNDTGQRLSTIQADLPRTLHQPVKMSPMFRDVKQKMGNSNHQLSFSTMAESARQRKPQSSETHMMAVQSNKVIQYLRNKGPQMQAASASHIQKSPSAKDLR